MKVMVMSQYPTMKELLNGELRNQIERHKSSIGPKGVRDARIGLCDHRDWDIVRMMCLNCGYTECELMERDYLGN